MEIKRRQTPLQELYENSLTECLDSGKIIIDLRSIIKQKCLERVRIMARPMKKTPEEWKKEILDAAELLFLSKGYEETSVSDIMQKAGGAKGLFYRFFESKEEAVHALGDRMFLENNPFDAVRGHTEWSGLRKIQELLAHNRAEGKRNKINMQAAGILKDPRILAAAVAANRRVLTPLWRELLEEGVRDGSIHTEYAKELSELLPLLNFWFLPSIFPASAEEICHKYRFAAELLSAGGLPILEGETAVFAENVIEGLSPREE